jgi:hypothetical protein
VTYRGVDGVTWLGLMIPYSGDKYRAAGNPLDRPAARSLAQPVMLPQASGGWSYRWVMVWPWAL